MRGPLSREQALEMAVAHALVRQADAGEFDEVLRFYQPLAPAVVFSRRLQRVLRGVYDMIGQPFDEGSVGSVGAEVAGLQAADLIDALVQSCTGGRTESFNHETTLKLAHELLAGHVVTPGPRRAAW